MNSIAPSFRPDTGTVSGWFRFPVGRTKRLCFEYIRRRIVSFGGVITEYLTTAGAFYGNIIHAKMLSTFEGCG